MSITFKNCIQINKKRRKKKSSGEMMQVQRQLSFLGWPSMQGQRLELQDGLR